MGNIKAVIFDMDGVLTETSEMHFLAWKALAESIGILIDRQFNEQLKGISRRDSLMKILKLGTKEYSEDELQVLMKQKNDHYLTLIETVTRENLCEGILDFIMVLIKKNIKIAVASASHSAPLLLKLLDIERYIDYVVNPGEVASKPSPEIFIKAAEGVEVSCLDCVGIEDAFAGVQAIKSAGMYAVGIGDKEVLKDANLVYENTSELNFEDIMRGYNG